jgi:hypothetical protein
MGEPHIFEHLVDRVVLAPAENIVVSLYSCDGRTLVDISRRQWQADSQTWETVSGLYLPAEFLPNLIEALQHAESDLHALNVLSCRPRRESKKPPRRGTPLLQLIPGRRP